jgi:hypothetical protein
MPIRVKVGQRHTHSHPIDVVLSSEADARRVWLVDIRKVGVTGGDACLIESLLGRRPSVPVVTPYWHRAITAVEIPRIIFVAFEFAEIWQAF